MSNFMFTWVISCWLYLVCGISSSGCTCLAQLSYSNYNLTCCTFLFCHWSVFFFHFLTMKFWGPDFLLPDKQNEQYPLSALLNFLAIPQRKVELQISNTGGKKKNQAPTNARTVRIIKNFPHKNLSPLATQIHIHTYAESMFHVNKERLFKDSYYLHRQQHFYKFLLLHLWIQINQTPASDILLVRHMCVLHISASLWDSFLCWKPVFPEQTLHLGISKCKWTVSL